MLSKSKQNQYLTGVGMYPGGITLHCTGNSLMAHQCYDIMEQSPATFAAHYFCDEHEVIQALPLSQGCWHTGKALDDGNLRTIAIEICQSDTPMETFRKAILNAANLIKELRQEFGDIPLYFHHDFAPQIYCPHRILSEYENKAAFMSAFGLE